MTIENWATVIISSLQNLWAGTFSILGDILGALVIVIVGLIVAAGLSALAERIISMVKLDKALKGLGVEEHFERAGIKLNSARFFGKLVYWFLVVVFLLAASDVLGFYTLSNFLREVAFYIPHVIVATLIMLASVMLANALRHLVKASVKSARLHAANFLSTLVWWSIVILGFFGALQELGIATQIVQALVTGFVAMLAIAGGIAFGLGGKEYASDLLEKLRDRVEEED